MTVPPHPPGDRTTTVHAHLQAQKLQHKTKEFGIRCVQRAANVRRPTLDRLGVGTFSFVPRFSTLSPNQSVKNSVKWLPKALLICALSKWLHNTCRIGGPGMGSELTPREVQSGYLQ